MRMLRIVWGCVFVGLIASSVAAQEAVPPAATQDAKVTVLIADTTAPSEWELRVPVSVKLAEGAEVGRLSMRFVYPSKILTFVSANATETLKGAGFGVTAEAAKIEGDVASVALTLQPADKKLTVLPAGVVTIVVLKVAEDAEEMKSWSLTAEDVKAVGRAPKAVELKAVAGQAGTLLIAPGGLPIFNCFFYMH